MDEEAAKRSQPWYRHAALPGVAALRDVRPGAEALGLPAVYGLLHSEVSMNHVHRIKLEPAPQDAEEPRPTVKGRCVSCDFAREYPTSWDSAQYWNGVPSEEHLARVNKARKR